MGKVLYPVEHNCLKSQYIKKKTISLEQKINLFVRVSSIGICQTLWIIRLSVFPIRRVSFELFIQNGFQKSGGESLLLIHLFSLINNYHFSNASMCINVKLCSLCKIKLLMCNVYLTVKLSKK